MDQQVFNDKVKQRLAQLGYEAVSEDDAAILFAVDKASWTVRNGCNLSDIPEGVLPSAVDMACGEFLFAKKNTGQLDTAEKEAMVRTISEGDVSVTFASDATPEQRFDSLVNKLRTQGQDAFARYRRLVW